MNRLPTGVSSSDLSMVVRYIDAADLDQALDWLKTHFDLIRVERTVDDYTGRAHSVSVRTAHWTAELDTIYRLLVAAQVYKDLTELKQLTLFDLLEADHA